MIAILAALDHEIEPVVSDVEVSDEGLTDAMAYWRGRMAGSPVVAVRTGVGPEKARAAAAAAVERFGPSLIVSIGYAGGLVDSLGGAAMVVAEGTVRNGERRALDPQHVDRAERAVAGLGIPCQRGWLVTVDKPLLTPESKRSAHTECGAIAVEMETAEIVGVAQDADVACVALRAVSDTAGQSWIIGSKCIIIRRGWRNRAKALGHLLLRPDLIPLAWRLHQQRRRSSQRLAAAVGHVVRDWSGLG